ncbi:ankyrin repeat domain-containing protein [Candidatus Pacearchaeota archaeon]|jgi:ankyrin repeat protein|nr:ankyrin repeat domain-containing protein [Candidatus Pacearchaeota archaeon]
MYTNLFEAVRNNDLQQVKRSIENNTDIHAANDYALSWAAYFEHFDIAKYLISCYSNIELKKIFSQFNNFYVKSLILERLYNGSQ